LLVAVIAELAIVGDEVRSFDVYDPAVWTAHRLRTSNMSTGAFGLAVMPTLMGLLLPCKLKRE
jgi:hypothetical protein